MFRTASIFILILLLSRVVGGQTQPSPPTQTGRTFTIQDVNPNIENQQRVITARQLIDQRNFTDAAALLELAYEKNPQDQLVLNLLKNCYIELKQYSKAEALLLTMISRIPLAIGYKLELAELLAGQGFRDSAIQVYRSAVSLIQYPDSIRFRLVITSEIGKGLDDDAFKLIDSVRTVYNNPLMFSLERGSVLEHRQQYTQSVKEYLPLLAQDTTNDAMEAERRIIALLDFQESSPSVEKQLMQEIHTPQNFRIIRLLESYYIRKGNFDQAFELAILNDSIESTEGMNLMFFMAQCKERKAFSSVVKMGDYLFLHYPNSPIGFQASLMYAYALEEIGRWQEAVHVYDKIRTTSPRPADQGEALYLKGKTLLDDLNDPAGALACFDTVLSGFRTGSCWFKALRYRPFCFLRTGDIDSADASFEQSRSKTNVPDMVEEATYYQGLILLFKNQPDSASKAMRRLMGEFPKGLYVNDVLQHIMSLAKAKDSPDLIENYAKVQLYEERRLPDSSRFWLYWLAQAENKALADFALNNLIIINLTLHDTTAALDCADKLAAEFPDSYYLPYGLKQKADILALSLKDVEQAKTLYRQILTSCPNCPFVTEVREKLRRLDVDKKTSCLPQIQHLN